MNQTIDAIYEDGVFKPLERPVKLPEHGRVRLTIDTPSPAPSWSELFSPLPQDNAKELTAIIAAEFESVESDAWK